VTQSTRNASLALSLGAFALGMVMLSYASVPLYRLFCQATGFGGVAEKTTLAAPRTLVRSITVRFDANVSGGLPWRFKPAQHDVTLKLGEEKHVEYIAENLSGLPLTGTATFNITPVKAGGYFDKIQCFCFTEQSLKPHETRRMGVTFFVDPALAQQPDLNDISTITLSYTFFPVQGKR
jgi:cytochrome c oxidase assembly protein subunit 11